jgi:energy-coupling factor transporter ATP-binding protein EcfA2
VIVRSIRVANWRCLLDEIEVGPFEDGLNILHAPNGFGKSTLFEALRRALLDGHRVTGRDVEALRPWGRTLAPRVSVEFAHGGQGYRISKQFLDSPSALLERQEEGRWRRLADGAGADERAREILTKNPPGRGLARPENWGLAQVLWAPQGSLLLAALSGDLVTDIRTMLNAQMSGRESGPLEKRIEERYLEFFTPKGKLKMGKDAPRLSRLREALAEAAEERRKAYDLCMAFEEASRKVEELQARRAQARHTADETTKALREARLVAETYQSLVAERKHRSEQVMAAEERYKRLRQLIDLIRGTESELKKAREFLSLLEKDIPLREWEVQEREREAARLRGALEDARKGREAVEAAARLADTARRFTECSRDLSRLDGLLGRIREEENTVSAEQERRRAVIAPDGKALRAIRKAIKERDDARVRLEASLITLEIVPLADGIVEVVAGEATGTRALTAGVPAQIQGSPEVVAELPGIARLRARGPAGSVDEHREARTRAEVRLAELTRPYPTSDPDALESLKERARELDARIAQGEARLETLRAGRTPEQLIQQRAVLESTLRGFLEGHHEWAESPPDVEALAGAAEEIKGSFIAIVESAERTWEKAQAALTAASGQRETLLLRLEDTRRQVTSVGVKLAELTGDGKSLPEREGELQSLSMAWEAARGRLAEVDGRLAEYHGDPVATVGILEAQREAALQESDRARDLEIREEANLERLSAQGPYSALVPAEEKVAHLEGELRREELRVEAVRLLHETVAACRAEALGAVAGPVEAVATRTLQRIAGGRLGRIRVGDGFEPAAVVPDVVAEAVSLDNLSGGEQEQLYLATRLALAEVLAREERQLVVLDDVLTATDSGRLARVMAVLEEAAERLQVLILTCHPERYRGLRQGRFFDFEALVRERGGG